MRKYVKECMHEVEAYLNDVEYAETVDIESITEENKNESAKQIYIKGDYAYYAIYYLLKCIKTDHEVYRQLSDMYGNLGMALDELFDDRGNIKISDLEETKSKCREITDLINSAVQKITETITKLKIEVDMPEEVSQSSGY